MLSSEQLQRYREDGVLVLRGLLPLETVRGLRDDWQALKAELAAGSTRLWRDNRFVHGGDLPRQLGSIFRHPVLAEVASDICGPDVACYMNRLLVKDFDWNGAVAPHQDCVYFHGSVDKLSVFVPLEPFTHAAGNVKFVVGSHRFGNLGKRGHIHYDRFPEMPLLDPDAMPGDVILADFRIWHHSELATEPSERPLMQIAYQPASDGSYYGQPEQPELVTGQWRTEYFTNFMALPIEADQ